MCFESDSCAGIEAVVQAAVGIEPGKEGVASGVVHLIPGDNGQGVAADDHLAIHLHQGSSGLSGLLATEAIHTILGMNENG